MKEEKIALIISGKMIFCFVNSDFNNPDNLFLAKS